MKLWTKEHKGIEMRGKESELKEYFYDRKRLEDKRRYDFSLFKMSSWNRHQRVWALIGIIFFVLIMIDAFAISMAFENYNHKYYMSSTEVNAKLNSYLAYADMPWYKIIIISLLPYMGGIAIAIILGWIFHGVGFKLIG